MVFDKDKVKANATYEAPRQAATGILHVLVNGQFAVENNRITGQRAGRTLTLGA